ncbi:IS1182 family transposase [Geomesophilobacter sediminis]|uniref:IS1182 family transposase n=1 Tax=Geomesophilobacter sediminis TaxID=2798584 RepID=A0A8J7M3C7_9BACT|nr:IS1182 family transposase [Geomesophilobacter sediminis]MBJ6728025.1 IS1182 family transposase [Geomesophilobacter sediminis]
MMGVQQQQSSLFYNLNLDTRIRADHPLRKISQLIDFDFVYDEVKRFYGRNGNESVPPPVVIKLMLLLVFYNVRSERELMDTLPERLDWLWFLGYDLDSSIPNHSVLSKARKRWGMEVFSKLFQRTVAQCVTSGLVDGSKIFMDSSLVKANASNNSVIDMEDLTNQLREDYKKLEARLEERNDSSRQYVKKNSRYVSTTDPDAAIVNRGTSKLLFQVHRVVDEKAEVITATEATPGDVNEGHRMMPLVEQHQKNTGTAVSTVVADTKYGTIENFLACHDSGIEAHVPDLQRVSYKRVAQRGLFTEEGFQYNGDTDSYTCPAGHQLKRMKLHLKRSSIDYKAPSKVCAACKLKPQCTEGKSGRSIKRHLRQAELDVMREKSRSDESKKDIKTRQHLMERSFAYATRFNFDRARWRGLIKMHIQEYLTCAIQNIKKLMKTMEPLDQSVAN